MKPILFNTEMTKAILEGRKSVTRRAIRLDLGMASTDNLDSSYLYIPDQYGDYHDAKDLCRYQVGDYLYVRETFCEVPYEHEHILLEDGYIKVPKIAYRADSEIDYTGIWKPSIHMPKALARMFLKVIDVRVEKLQDMCVADCVHEGVEVGNAWTVNAKPNFIELWNSTIKKPDLAKYGWEANPWVWVIEFERVE